MRRANRFFCLLNQDAKAVDDFVEVKKGGHFDPFLVHLQPHSVRVSPTQPSRRSKRASCISSPRALIIIIIIIIIMIRQFIIRRRNISMKSLQGRRTPGSRDKCRTAPDGTPEPTDLSHWPALGRVRD